MRGRTLPSVTLANAEIHLTLICLLGHPLSQGEREGGRLR